MDTTSVNVEGGTSPAADSDTEVSLPPHRLVNRQRCAHLLCAICHGLPLTPVQPPCRHVFCQLHLHKWVVSLRNHFCPVCSGSVTEADVNVEVPLSLQRALKAVKVHCAHHPDHHIHMERVQDHERHRCEHRPKRANGAVASTDDGGGTAPNRTIAYAEHVRLMKEQETTLREAYVTRKKELRPQRMQLEADTHTLQAQLTERLTHVEQLEAQLASLDRRLPALQLDHSRAVAKHTSLQQKIERGECVLEDQSREMDRLGTVERRDGERVAQLTNELKTLRVHVEEGPTPRANNNPCAATTTANHDDSHDELMHEFPPAASTGPQSSQSFSLLLRPTGSSSLEMGNALNQDGSASPMTQAGDTSSPQQPPQEETHGGEEETDRDRDMDGQPSLRGISGPKPIALPPATKLRPIQGLRPAVFPAAQPPLSFVGPSVGSSAAVAAFHPHHPLPRSQLVFSAPSGMLSGPPAHLGLGVNHERSQQKTLAVSHSWK